jgi:hypothetical protein
MINYNSQLDILFDNIWERKYPEYTFVRDGIMRNIPNENEAWFNAKRRVAFLLKDKSDGSCDDVRNWLIDNDNPNNQKNRKLSNKLFRNIANVLYGLTHDECHFCKVENNPDVEKCLLSTPFAYIECKKEAGGGCLEDNVLIEYLEKDADLLQMQLSILKPNIIVCSGWPINEFVRGMFLKENLYIQGNNLAYCHKTKTLIILGYHPTAPFINTRQHFAGTMEHYKKLLDTKYGKEFIASLMD